MIRETARLLAPLPLDAPTLAALEVVRPTTALTLLYEAAMEAGLEREEATARSAGCGLLWAVGNLADDLIDDEHGYIEARYGPSVQYLLHNAALSILLASSVEREAITEATTLLAQAVPAQHVEVQDGAWDFDKFVHVGAGICANAWAAYLHILWSGTELEPSAGPLGRALGTVGHVAEDMRSGDHRYWSMTPDDRARTRAWARSSAEVAAATGLKTARFVLDVSLPVLESDGAVCERA